MARRRKHRKVKGVPKGWKGCKCPSGATKVSTCTTKNGKKLCRGRGWGCLGIGPSQRGKSSPRFVKAICPDSEPKALPAGPTPKLLGPGTSDILSRTIARSKARE